MENKAIQFYGQFGLVAAFYLKSQYFFIEEKKVTDRNSVRSEFIRPINLGINSGLGILYTIGPKWKLGGEIPFNIHILTSSKKEFLNQRFYSYGLNVVVQRSF